MNEAENTSQDNYTYRDVGEEVHLFSPEGEDLTLVYRRNHPREINNPKGRRHRHYLS
jgi:hypothetical protein